MELNLAKAGRKLEINSSSAQSIAMIFVRQRALLKIDELDAKATGAPHQGAMLKRRDALSRRVKKSPRRRIVRADWSGQLLLQAR